MANSPGIFKQLLSYFTDVVIENTGSRINPILLVTLSSGRYKLDTKSATYSFEDRYNSYGTALKVIADRIPGYKNALVLGLGLGSIPLMLITKHGFKGVIDCIEIDPEVIRLATKYFKIQPVPDNIRFINSDALDFVKNDQQKYDLITVDLFFDRNIPIQFHTDEFLNSLKAMLAPGGTLLFSRLTENLQKEKRLNTALKNNFAGAQEIDTNGNLILCWQSPDN